MEGKTTLRADELIKGLSCCVTLLENAEALEASGALETDEAEELRLFGEALVTAASSVLLKFAPRVCAISKKLKPFLLDQSKNG